MTTKTVFSAFLAAVILFCSGTAIAAKGGNPDKDELEQRIADLEALVTALQTDLAANTAADAVAHHAKYTNSEAIAAVGPHSPDLTNDVAFNAAGIAANAGDISNNASAIAGNSSKLQFVTVDFTELNGLEGPHVIFENANVHIKSQYGATGNLIIGDNIPSNHPDYPSVRTGWHNIVVGDGHAFTGHSGLVTGLHNQIMGEANVAIGGEENSAIGFRTVIIGGRNNEASDTGVVVGGTSNLASGEQAFVGGGDSNTSSGRFSTVTGGRNNEASEYATTVSGGDGMTATSPYCVVGDDRVDC